MKIGEFAKKNNITQDTIRHYIDLGLLVAEKQGSQYRFTEEDSGDLERIVMLKQLDFSLTEIQEILCFYRLEGEKSDDFRSFYLSLLERKKEQVRIEQLKFQEIDGHIRKEITELKMDELGLKRRIGFPITSMPLLQCPECKSALDISGGTIEKNMLMEADFQCECGYVSYVEDGIYIDKAAVGKKKQIPPKKDFLEAASPKYINFLYNGTSTLIDYIQNHGSQPGYIMELDNCVGRFLMQYIDFLPKGCTYILICHDKQRITHMKRNIELQQEHGNFIFFCCELDRLPVAPASIDIIVDHWMSKTYAKTADKDLLDIVSPFLKQEGLLIGAYPHLGKQCKDYLHVPLELRDLFNRDKMLEKLHHLNFAELDVSELGPITENNPYIDIQGKEQYLTLYVGKKKRSFDVICAGAQQEMKLKQNRIS
ncbi:MerR family transcriptional regulator [Fontibacillus sp. BL9]|uniref:MerR family transcriptional regulator n=1 Tax=Fontibacillus sp. BL9 TaxID=3389971 RepID=UPI00397DF3D8